MKIIIIIIIILLASKENQSCHKESICYVCKREINTDDKKYDKARDHCHYTG